MQRVAFKMKLYRGCEAEYQQRHKALWPELYTLLKDSGIADYSIFLDEATGDLFGYLSIGNSVQLAELPGHPVMQRWWEFMKDIMETTADHSPVSIPLTEVFYLK